MGWEILVSIFRGRLLLVSNNLRMAVRLAYLAFSLSWILFDWPLQPRSELHAVQVAAGRSRWRGSCFPGNVAAVLWALAPPPLAVIPEPNLVAKLLNKDRHPGGVVYSCEDRNNRHAFSFIYGGFFNHYDRFASALPLLSPPPRKAASVAGGTGRQFY